MHSTFTSSWNGRWSILSMLTIIALLHNWASKNCILAYGSLAYEKDLIAEFRELVQDLATKDFMKSDGYLLRWLRYTNFDVEKAYKAFEHSINWRKENNIDNVLKEGYSSIEENYAYSFNGFDREGRPVVTIELGKFDIRKIMIAGEQNKYQRAVFRNLELRETYLQEIRDGTGFDNITQAVVIFDLAGFNLQQTACLNCLKMAPDYINAYEPNYPYISHKIFVINAPRISYSAIQLAKHFMAKETKEAMQVFDYNKDKWSKALLEQISPENLPIKYGGIKPDFDKASFATRNAAVIHLLGDRKDSSKPTVNYDGHKVTTGESGSHYQSYNLEENKSSEDTFAGQNISNDSDSVNVTQDYHPISWFDTAAFTTFHWTAPEHKLPKSSSIVFGLAKGTSTMHNDKEKEIIYPHNRNRKQKHHHHYRKITQRDQSKQFTRSIGYSKTTGQNFSDAVAAANNLCTGSYVLLMSLIFAQFLIFIY